MWILNANCAHNHDFNTFKMLSSDYLLKKKTSYDFDLFSSFHIYFETIFSHIP